MPKATCYFLKSGTEKRFPSLEEALSAAIAYCGNNRSVKPFSGEDTYLFGPGNGDTTVMVRTDFKSRIKEEST